MKARSPEELEKLHKVEEQRQLEIDEHSVSEDVTLFSLHATVNLLFQMC